MFGKWVHAPPAQRPAGVLSISTPKKQNMFSPVVNETCTKMFTPKLSYMQFSSGRSWGHGCEEHYVRSVSRTTFVARKAEIKQCLVFGIKQVTNVLSVFTFGIWNAFTQSVSNLSKIAVAERDSYFLFCPILIWTFHLSYLLAKLEMPSCTIWLCRHKSAREQKLPYLIAKFSGLFYWQFH